MANYKIISVTLIDRVPKSITDMEHQKRSGQRQRISWKRQDLNWDMRDQHTSFFLVGEGCAEDCCLSGFSKEVED